MKIKSILAVLALALAGVSFAKTDSTFPVGNIPYNSKGDVEPGEWTSQYAKAKAQAEAEDKPLLVYWGNNGCGHCEALERAIGGSAKFASWQKEYGIYMVFTIGGSTFSEAAVAKEAARDSSGQFPYIGVYWHGKKLGSFSGNGISVDAFISKTETLLKGYSPNQGGYFAVPRKDETEGHRYEAEISADKAVTVEVKMVRDAKAVNATGKDSVVVSGPDKKQIGKALSVEWKKGDSEKIVKVTIPAKTFTTAGQAVYLNINDKGTNDNEFKTVIYAVNPENSATNPDFSGCTAFGEWTMDLGAAKTFAKDKGYVLVGLFGSLWCHDCANTERNFLDLMDGSKNRFKEWAKSKNVALVMLDIPNFSTSSVDCKSPCLLKADPYETTLAYEKGKNTTENFYDVSKGGAPESLLKAQKRSGLGYMSRRGVSETAAKTRLSTFHDLAYKSPENGGYHIYFGKDDVRNEDGNANRTGVPIFVLLRKDGTVAARLTRFASESPMKADQSKFDLYIKRFNEMLNTADNKPYDGTEIGNNYPSAGSIPAKLDESNASGRLTHADSRDSFKLDCNGAAVVTVTVESWAENAQVTAQFIQEQGGKFVNVGKPVSGPIGKGDSFGLTADFQKTGACYLLIKGDVTSPEFAIDSTEGTYRLFQVRAKATALYPQEAESRIFVLDGTTKIKVEQDKQYRITGLGATDADKLEKIGDDTYLAKVSDFVTVPVAQARTTIAYQTWNPGTVSFRDNEPEGGISESIGVWDLVVGRGGGVSGEARVKLSVNKEETDFYYDWDTKELPRFMVDGNPLFESTELVWDDGMKGGKHLQIQIENIAQIEKFYGDGQIVFDIEPVNGTVLGEKTRYTLKVKEDQKPTPSVIAIAATDPAFAYSRKVYARKSSTVRLTLSREGTYGAGRIGLVKSDSSATLSGDDGLLGDAQWWENHRDDDKTVTVGNLPAPEKSVKITLAKKEDMFLPDDEANWVKIVSVADDAPAFVAGDSYLALMRYTDWTGGIDFDPAFCKGGELSFEIMSGKIPDGLAASVDQKNKRLVFKGVAKTTGTYPVCLKAIETRGGVKVLGMPVSLTFRVLNPYKISADDPVYGHLVNMSVKTARTMSDMIVFTGLKFGEPEEDPYSRMTGKLQVTVPTSGKINGKYVCREGTISFSNKKGWRAKALDDADGTLYAEAQAGNYTFTVRAYPSGKIGVTMDDKGQSRELVAGCNGKPWSSENPATSWKGRYTAVLVPGGTEVYRGQGVYEDLPGSIDGPENAAAQAPCGCGYLVFNMTKGSNVDAGLVKWAGKLPCGTAISGSSTLTKGVHLPGLDIGTSGQGYLPIFTVDDTDYVSMVAEIKAKAAKEGPSRAITSDFGIIRGEWERTITPAEAKCSYRMDLHVFGSYYDPDVSLKSCCQKSGEDPDDFEFDIERLDKAGYNQGVRGKMKTIDSLTMKIEKHDIRIVDTVNPRNVELTFDRETGVVSGTFDLPVKYTGIGSDSIPATFGGVVLSGWGELCACGEGVATGVYLPFVCGGFYFTDQFPYQTGGGEKVKKAKSGGMVGAATAK